MKLLASHLPFLFSKPELPADDDYTPWDARSREMVAITQFAPALGDIFTLFRKIPPKNLSCSAALRQAGKPSRRAGVRPLDALVGSEPAFRSVLAELKPCRSEASLRSERRAKSQ